jgi:hypothetical protein
MWRAQLFGTAIRVVDLVADNVISETIFLFRSLPVELAILRNRSRIRHKVLDWRYIQWAHGERIWFWGR